MFTLSLLLCIPMLTIVLSQRAGNVKQNDLLPFSVQVDGTRLASSVTIDANWRWVHNVGGYTNCYDNGWNPQFCPDPITCVRNCELEGVPISDYTNVYGVVSTNNQLTLKYVTGTNVGSRMYVLQPSGKAYQIWKLKNREFRFTVDVSKLPCGTNGAVYFVEMPADGGLNDLNKAGAPYGTGYGDAQGPKDIKFIKGFANTNQTGVFSPEFDVWEANSQATMIASHPCSIRGVQTCINDNECGFNGFCDKHGGDLNPYRLGNTQLYGSGQGFQVDTNKPFVVVTQFFTNDNSDTGQLVRIRRFYEQNGKRIEGGEMTDVSINQNKQTFNEINRHQQLGGLTEMGNAMGRGMVLVLSLWDDSFANMKWLDSVYPPNGNNKGDKRGPCPQDSGVPAQTRAKYPDAQVIYSDVQLRSLTSTSAPTSQPPTSVPTKPPATCQSLYMQCGGIQWSGSTCCSQGTCTVMNAYYSQCLPSTTPTPTPTPSTTPTPSPTNVPKCSFTCQECVRQCV